MAILWGCSNTDTQSQMPPAAAPTWAIRTIESPCGESSMAPSLIQLEDGTPVLSWLDHLPDGVTRLAFAEWKDQAFGTPIEVARGTNWYAGKSDIPGLVAGPNHTLLAHYRINSYGDYAYGIRVMLSQNDGRTWLPPVCPHENNTQAEFGFLSALPDDKGGFMIAWLDGRETMIPTPDGKGKMPTTLRTATLNAQGKLENETVRDNRVCDCCPTAAIPYGTHGLLAYRDRSDTEVRDIRLAAPLAHQDLASNLFPADDWQVEGCPVNGPSAALRDSAHAAIAWFSAPDGKAKVQVAFSENDYQFGKAILLDSNQVRGRIHLTTWGENLAACWVVSDGKTESIKIAEVEWGTGKILNQIIHTPTSRLYGNPKLVAQNSSLILAWPVIDSLPHIQVGILEKN